MKMSHFSIIIMSVFVISLAFTTNAFAQNSTAYSSSNDLGSGNVFFMTTKDLFLPGDLVEVNGSLITPNPIIITLDDPHGEMVTSKTTFSDREGYFTTELKIPANAEAGIWKIVGTSGIYHRELNFTITGNSNTATTCYAGNLCSTFVANNTVQYGPKLMTQTAINSPLKQFKSGIKAEDVKCKQDLTLIFRAEDNFPACVKPDTASKLVERGWAMSSLKNFGYNPGRGPASPEPKESGQFSSIGPSPFPPSTLNRLVFFIKSNSTAQIHVRYTSEFENTGNVDTGGQFYSGNPHDFIPLDSSQITISSSPDHVSMNYGTNTTVVYEISTKNVTSGLYWIVLTQICGAIPVAIDTTSSQITPSDIPVYSQHCPAQVLNAKILGISGGNAEYLQSQELQ